MTEKFADAVERHTILNQPRGERVPVVVPGVVRDAGFFECGLKPVIVRQDGLFRLARIAKDRTFLSDHEGSERKAASALAFSGAWMGSSFLVRGTWSTEANPPIAGSRPIGSSRRSSPTNEYGVSLLGVTMAVSFGVNTSPRTGNGTICFSTPSGTVRWQDAGGS